MIKSNSEQNYEAAYCWNIFWRELVGGVWNEKTGFTHCTIPHNNTLDVLHGVSSDSKMQQKALYKQNYDNNIRGSEISGRSKTIIRQPFW